MGATVVSLSARRTDSVLTALYREHAADAFRFALHLTGRREDAEEVVQQAFLQAHRHLESGRDFVNPKAWLMTAVRHRSYDVVRDRREVPVDGLVPEWSAPAADTDEASELAAVRSMLWTLPEKQHHAFVLRHWSGLSQREIAVLLETTPSAVESLLSRARTALVAEHENPSSECADVRRRLVDAVSLPKDQLEHLRSCQRCRTAQARLARAAGFAATFAPVPGSHAA
jgi:RNA polymerase sigma-70 factor (ECF subfamily)